MLLKYLLAVMISCELPVAKYVLEYVRIILDNVCTHVRITVMYKAMYIVITFQWMLPSTGHLTPTWVKALVIDTGDEQICFVTVDAIGMC